MELLRSAAPVLSFWLGLTFFAAAVAKTFSPTAAQSIIKSILGVSKGVSRFGVYMLVAVEMALGVLLLLWPTDAVAIVAAVLLCLFIFVDRIYVDRGLGEAKNSDCGCFGAIDEGFHPAVRTTRTLVLLTVALAIALLPGESSPDWISALSGTVFFAGSVIAYYFLGHILGSSEMIYKE